MYDEYDVVDITNLIVLDYIKENKLLDNFNNLEISEIVTCFKLPLSINDDDPNAIKKYNFFGFTRHRFSLNGKFYDIDIKHGKLDLETVKKMLDKDVLTVKNIEELRKSASSNFILNKKYSKDTFIDILKNNTANNPYIIIFLSKILNLDVEMIIADYISKNKDNMPDNYKKILNYSFNKINELCQKAEEAFSQELIITDNLDNNQNTQKK